VGPAVSVEGCRETAVSQDPLIACIDDHKSVRDAIEEFLKAFGFAVQAFSSAEDFLQSSRLNQTSCQTQSLTALVRMVDRLKLTPPKT
jgi:hypothetical protein